MPKQKTRFELHVDRVTKELYQPEYHYVQVRQARTFMKKNLSKRIELDEIAATAFMSRFHFIRIFKQVYGITPRECLKDLRINKAKELLSEGVSVTQTCYEVGYQSIPTFSSAFKRGTGRSPSAYREMNKSNQG